MLSPGTRLASRVAVFLPAILIAGAALAHQACAQQDLVAYWRFDGDGEDDNGDFPLDFNEPVRFDDGLLGQAIAFDEGGQDETGSVARPVDDADFNFGDSDYTIQAWVNYDTVAGEQVLIEKFTGSGGPGWTLTKLANGEFHFFVGTAPPRNHSIDITSKP